MIHPAQLLTAVCLLLLGCSSASDGTADMDGTTLPSGGSAGASSGGGGSGGALADMGGSTSVAGSGTAGTGGDSADIGGAANGGTGGAGGISGVAGASGAGGMNGSAGAGGKPPSTTPIDYSVWELQLPIGTGTSPTTIKSAELQAGFKDEYFYVAPDGGQTLMDPKTGITTGGSAHCRTELREMTAGGQAASWASTGTNTLSVEGKVLMLGDGNSGNVTVAQVFGGDIAPLLELQYSGSRGGFQVLYEEAKGGGSTTDLKTPVALNTRYAFVLSLSSGVLTVSINGKQVYTHTPSAAASKTFYFKLGNYDQHASAGAISTTPFTIVEAYSAAVVHN